jgi:amidophosphoribosyltransferase
MPLTEKCAVFGVYGRGLEAARLVHTGLWTLQHRGQESSGISVADGTAITTHKGMGLVAHVYDEAILDRLTGHVAIGHNRYSTSGGSHADHSQPVTSASNLVVLAHNGNLPAVARLVARLERERVDIAGCNDSELMHRAIEHAMRRGASVETAVRDSFDLFTGVFSMLLMTRDKLVAVRDRCGIRPLAIGSVDGGFVVSSETCAIDAVRGSFLREVRPGEMVVVDAEGMHSTEIVEGREKLDIFEFVYFARPDSILMGRVVNDVRQDFGAHLAMEHPVRADLVIPVPDSGVPAAVGYARQSGVPLDFGLLKNRYIHRTFIRPAQHLRESGVRLKLNPIPGVLGGKRVAVIDDSIVRGTTARQIVDLIRAAGAKEVHFLVSSPPVRFPDFYGIDTPRRGDLIAAHMSIDEVRAFIHADSLGYLSYEAMIAATRLPEHCFSTSSFTGIYPVDLGEKAALVA